MKTQLTPIASAVAIALASAMLPAFAQEAPKDAAQDTKVKAKAEDAQQVVVTGIRGSMQQSLNQKRNAESHVEVITAEDIGKMPDKNVADSLARVPGVTISSAGATEGGFDENDRISMRGTNPSLTQTLVNGHNVSSGDWFVLNQSGTVGRSVSYTLLPSELVGSVVVHKSSQASLVEGGVAGSVDIISRKPLDFKKPLTVDASIGAVYATLPSKTDPQISGLINWKSDSGVFGVLLQGFSETRHLRRDGQEILGYEQISATSAAAKAHPDLANVWMPTAIGSALFEQERKRTGGLLDVQFKPNDTVTLDLSAFRSNLSATNYNRNYLLWATHAVGSGAVPDAGYVVRNNTLVQANFAKQNDAAGNPIQMGIYDQISRPGEGASSNFYNLDGTFNLSPALTITTKLGTSKGVGKTPVQDVAEWDIKNTGAAWKLNGINSAADWSLPGGDTSKPVAANTSLDWIFGLNHVTVNDSENWQQVDGTYALDMGSLVSLKFGARNTDHTRESLNVVAQGPLSGAFTAANQPSVYQNYPGNFGKGLGGNFPRNIWYYSAADLNKFDAAYTNRDLKAREYFPNEFSVKEGTTAAYLQANLEGKGWSGDVGLRSVSTSENIITFQPATASTPGALTESLFGPYVPVNTLHTYNDLLPSANLKLDVSKDVVVRLAASKTMTRADYSALAGTVNLSPPAVATGIGSGSGGNPDLKPIVSTNVDATAEWYFAPRSLVSLSVYAMNLNSYVGLGHVTKNYLTYDALHPNGQVVTYDLSVPVNSSGKVHGFEVGYEQPVYGNFGVQANLTYTNAKEAGGGPLVGASKNTYNLGGYFENDWLNARLSYTHRSSFYSGLDRSTAYYQASTGDVSASIGYKVSDNLTVQLDGRNLNDPKLKYYALNEDQPRSIYQNGRQFFLTARVKF